MPTFIAFVLLIISQSEILIFFITPVLPSQLAFLITMPSSAVEIKQCEILTLLVPAMSIPSALATLRLLFMMKFLISTFSQFEILKVQYALFSIIKLSTEIFLQFLKYIGPPYLLGCAKRSWLL